MFNTIININKIKEMAECVFLENCRKDYLNNEGNVDWEKV